MNVGDVHFPITSSHPEAQAWFEQGVALLHGFWPFEAERAFRWVAHLDPECAMAYWGLAQACEDDAERRQAFLDQALEHADAATDRERAFIDLAVASHQLEASKGDSNLEREVGLLRDKLVMDHPDDLEALAFASLAAWERSRGENRLGVEMMVRHILERDPDHVGALHYRIHNWDGKEGSYAVDSCRALSAAAPDCGHLQHMPGHVLSGIGMWHEAAIAQDTATRVEQRYMNRRRVMPEDNWNYLHNLDYLAYVQGQLGMNELALETVLQLVIIPLHELPFDDQLTGMLGNPMRMGIQRELIRAERWEDILDGGVLAWPKQPKPAETISRQYGLAHAHLALGDHEAASACLDPIRKAAEQTLGMLSSLPDGEGPPPEMMDEVRAMFEMPALEIEALLDLAEGRSLEGIGKLTELAERQADSWSNDPPPVPHFAYNLLGDALLELGSPELAAQAYEKTLETVFEDGIALAGLVQAYHLLDRDAEAAQAMARLEIVWAEADPDNGRLVAARATGVAPDPGRVEHPMVQRRYGEQVISVLGPCRYEPAPAPALTARDAEGREVSLAEYRGHSVLLLFYLGDQCTHCIEQLTEANDRFERFAELGVDLLAISKDAVEENAAIQEAFRLRLLSDPAFATAKRYGSYDDFEDMELHSTVLIDPEGRIHFIETGGEPFMDFDFLEQEAERLGKGGVVHDIRSELIGMTE
jgi:peroxiredoxin